MSSTSNCVQSVHLQQIHRSPDVYATYRGPYW